MSTFFAGGASLSANSAQLLGARAGPDAAWQAIMTHGGLAMPGYHAE